MKIYLLDRNPQMVNIWKLYFRDAPEVSAICDEFSHFMDTTKIECVVSPANSYGLMDGGYDLAISEWFGWELQEKVQEYIIGHFRGEQPVGTSFMINTGIADIKLIHTPSMRIPSVIKEPMVVYQCMRTCLITAIENNIQSIVIPAFGGFCGCLREQIICRMMYEAYKQVMNPPRVINWDYACRWELERE